jgi:amino acid transporter
VGPSEHRLGTFAGVFTPSILTILGLVLFLRLGYVVGNVGMIRAVVILTLATTVSVLTSFSLATAASNLNVRGGGVYFLISRTLGIEFGGAVGLVLFVAMSVSVAFYSIGFAEAVVAMWGSDDTAAIRIVAATCVVVLLYFAWLGADWATRLQFLIMGLLILALLAFFIGAFDEFSRDTLNDGLGRPDTDVGFWEAFAIFFPAVTGFTQGVAMSGDLRTPSRSIVRGTLAAVAISTAVYLTVIVVLSGARPLATLRGDTSTVMGDISVAGWAADAGVIAATVSSGMASLLGAPRVLQRVAEDRIVPPLSGFAAGTGPLNNPRRATLFAAAIALGTVAAGNINTVAPVISMFFLATYGLINYATYFEARSASTSFRPRFRWFHPRVSLAGAVACAVVVIAINPVAGAVAAIVLWAIHSYLRAQEVPERWSDSVHAHHYAQARRHIVALSTETGGELDWRPCILVFVPHDHEARGRVLMIATWLEGEAGFTTAVRVIEGSGPVRRREAADICSSLERELATSRINAFARTLLASDLRSGIQSMVQSHGLGSVRANTVVFGWKDLSRVDDSDHRRFGEILQECARFDANVLIVRMDDPSWSRLQQTPPTERTIGVWWSDDRSGQLMTLMAWLCTRSPEWGGARIEVFVPGPETVPSRADDVRAVLDHARIETRVVPVTTPESPVGAHLADVTLALLPLRIRRNEPLGPNETPIGRLGSSLPVTVLVLANEDLDLDAEPDETRVARHAEARDAAAEARSGADELDALAARLLVEAEILRQERDRLGDGDSERHQELSDEMNRKEIEAAKAYRRYVDARSRADRHQRRADELDPTNEPLTMDPAAWDVGEQ